MKCTKQTLTIAATAAVTLGFAAAFGFGQPDGIDPPAGPVADTQPSLTSIDQKLNTLITSETITANTATRFGSLSQGEMVFLNVGSIRLVRVIMQQGSIIFEDDNGVSYDLEAGSVYDPGGQDRRLIDFSNELNIDLNGPIRITGDDNNNSSKCIFVYKELP